MYVCAGVQLFFHGKDYKSLHAHIDKSFLPKKYGGTATWELPSGKLLGEFFSCYSSDFESKMKNELKTSLKYQLIMFSQFQRPIVMVTSAIRNF